MGQDLDQDAVKRQVLRLSASPALAPREVDGWMELTECCLKHCDNEAHVKRAITLLLEETRHCQNLVAELMAAIADTRNAAVLPPGCDVCHGEPWVSTPNGAARCTCARGQALKRGMRR